MFQYGHAQVDLVIHSKYHTHYDVMANIWPVKVIPETLCQPVLGYLKLNCLKLCIVSNIIARFFYYFQALFFCYSFVSVKKYNKKQLSKLSFLNIYTKNIGYSFICDICSVFGILDKTVWD